MGASFTHKLKVAERQQWCPTYSRNRPHQPEEEDATCTVCWRSAALWGRLLWNRVPFPAEGTTGGFRFDEPPSRIAQATAIFFSVLGVEVCGRRGEGGDGPPPKAPGAAPKASRAAAGGGGTKIEAGSVGFKAFPKQGVEARDVSEL